MSFFIRVALRYLLPLALAPLAAAAALGWLALGTALSLALAAIFCVALPAVAGAHARGEGSPLRRHLLRLLALPLLVLLIVTVVGPRRAALPQIGSARVVEPSSATSGSTTDQKLALGLLALSGASFVTAWRLAGRVHRSRY